MDIDRTREVSKDIGKKLVSLDPVEFDSAINEYFEANATFEAQTVKVHGASKIKKLALFQALMAKDSEMTAQPKYNKETQILSLGFQRTYATPTLPTYIPVAGVFSNRQKTLHWDVDMHFLADEDGEGEPGAKGRKLYVTKVELKRRERIPFEGLLPFGIIRPVLSLLTLIIASIVVFTYQHKTDGPVSFVLAAIAALFNAAWELLLAEKGKREAQAEKWREEKEAQVNRLYDNALATATELQRTLETRARDAGVPVDEYKRQAGKTLEELRVRAQEAASVLEKRAREARDKVGQASGYFEGRLGEVRDKASQVTNDTPHTPLGGHDPTAPQAPSYAEATAST